MFSKGSKNKLLRCNFLRLRGRCHWSSFRLGNIRFRRVHFRLRLVGLGQIEWAFLAASAEAQAEQHQYNCNFHNQSPMTP